MMPLEKQRARTGLGDVELFVDVLVDRVAAVTAAERRPAAAVRVRVRPRHAGRHREILGLGLFGNFDLVAGQIERHRRVDHRTGHLTMLALLLLLRLLLLLLLLKSPDRGRCFSHVNDRRLGLLHLDVDVDVDVVLEVVAGERRRADVRARRLTAALVMKKMMPPTKAHLTVLALERLLAFVDQQVRLQLIRVAELRRAQLTGVRPLAGVDAQVTTEIRHLNELTVAVTAVVRLLAGVQPHVRLQMMVPSESAIGNKYQRPLVAGKNLPTFRNNYTAPKISLAMHELYQMLFLHNC